MDKLLKEKRFVYLRLAKIERSRAVARALARVSMPWQQKIIKTSRLLAIKVVKNKKLANAPPSLKQGLQKGLQTSRH